LARHRLVSISGSQPDSSFIPFRTIVHDRSRGGWMFVINFVFIEIGQLVSGRRVPDVDDLILSTRGGGSASVEK
jgi:hypothetical protein